MRCRRWLAVDLVVAELVAIAVVESRSWWWTQLAAVALVVVVAAHRRPQLGRGGDASRRSRRWRWRTWWSPRASCSRWWSCGGAGPSWSPRTGALLGHLLRRPVLQVGPLHVVRARRHVEPEQRMCERLKLVVWHPDLFARTT
jgi:hypothetical protein